MFLPPVVNGILQTQHDIVLSFNDTSIVGYHVIDLTSWDICNQFLPSIDLTFYHRRFYKGLGDSVCTVTIQEFHGIVGIVDCTYNIIRSDSG